MENQDTKATNAVAQVPTLDQHPMKTPEQWLEEFIESGDMHELPTTDLLKVIQSIQKDAVDEGLSRAITQLRSFLHNELHKVNFGHKP